MKRLARRASGSRHLRWGREILATVQAHLAHNFQLSAAQKQALQAEQTLLDQGLTALAGAVTPYRDFIDHSRVEIRACQRVADYLVDEAFKAADGALRPRRVDVDAAVPGAYGRIFSGLPLSRVLRAGHERTVSLARNAASSIRSLPDRIPGTGVVADALERAGELLASFNRQETEAIEPQRAPLKGAMERAISNLREGLEQMDGRLRSHFTAAFIESLYPELVHSGAAVADEDDEDDDDSEPVAPPAPGPVA